MDTPYRSRRPYADTGSSVLVIACSSNAFYPFLREFLENALGLAEGSFDVLLVPGGAQFLLLSDYLPKFAWVGRKWISFLVERHRLSRVVVVAHDDCAWYSEDRLLPAFLLRFGHDTLPAAERQKRDLGEIAASLRGLLPATSVEAWFAAKGADGILTFVRS